MLSPNSLERVSAKMTRSGAASEGGRERCAEETESGVTLIFLHLLPEVGRLRLSSSHSSSLSWSIFFFGSQAAAGAHTQTDTRRSSMHTRTHRDRHSIISLLQVRGRDEKERRGKMRDGGGRRECLLSTCSLALPPHDEASYITRGIKKFSTARVGGSDFAVRDRNHDREVI